MNMPHDGVRHALNIFTVFDIPRKIQWPADCNAVGAAQIPVAGGLLASDPGGDADAALTRQVNPYRYYRHARRQRQPGRAAARGVKTTSLWRELPFGEDRPTEWPRSMAQRASPNEAPPPSSPTGICLSRRRKYPNMGTVKAFAVIITLIG